jgi:hypothetical protein
LGLFYGATIHLLNSIIFFIASPGIDTLATKETPVMSLHYDDNKASKIKGTYIQLAFE